MASSRDTLTADPPDRRYCFGEYTLDLDRGFLRRGAEEVALRPKAFDVLTYLVERHGRLVTKTELIDAIWPDATVTDNSLAHCLSEIRRALADDSLQMIRTVSRRGYLFAAPVTVPSPAVDRGPGEPATAPPPSSVPASGTTARRSPMARAAVLLAAAAALVAIAAAGIRSLLVTPPSRTSLSYTQLTDFTDAAVAPALSPDGRILAFIRGEKWFSTPDQIFVKMLPDGEAIQLTRDPRAKYSVRFSPDGSAIAYTVAMGGSYNTYVVSPRGGEPRLLLTNAAGLTWLDPERFLYSEIKSGMHMGIVTAGADRAAHREVYFPAHERSMAHYAEPSPDRRWALVIEMDHRPVWQPCRLVPLDGRSSGTRVGPEGVCTGAGWSPDGSWMYFTAAVDEQHHVWRQRFPDGAPEQLTFGPAEEDGIAIMPDGDLVTSIGMVRRSIRIHDRAGDRELSSEGNVVNRLGSASFPSFSPDARTLYYLRHESPGSETELWRADVASGKSEPVWPGISMGEYDISNDGTEVVFTTRPVGKPSQIWLAPVNRASPPRQIAGDGANAPRFGANGRVLFRFTDSTFNYVGQMMRDGSARSKVVPYPISTFQNVSRDRRWLIAIIPLSDAEKTWGSMAVPTAGGPPRRICAAVCMCAWSPDGSLLYVNVEQKSRTSPGRTVAIPVDPETGLPNLPEAGIHSAAEALSIAGSHAIEQADIVPGPDPATYAYIQTTVQRNIFRIRLP